MDFLVPINLQQNELQNPQIHNLNYTPGTGPASPVIGQIFYNTADSNLYRCTATGPDVWEKYGRVDSVTASGSYISIGGSATAPTVAVTNTTTTGGGANASKLVLTDGSGDINFTTGNINVTAAPTSGTNLTNKDYVDGLINGLSWKDAVRAGTTVDVLTLGTGGAWAAGQFTWSAGPTLIDTVSIQNNDRILVKNQANTNENGIYVRTSATQWDRVADMNVWAEVPSAAVFIAEGSQADTAYTCTSDTGGTIDVTPITWVLFASSTSYTAGQGINISGGNIISIDFSTGALTAIPSTIQPTVDRIAIYDNSGTVTGGYTIDATLTDINLNTTSNATFGTVNLQDTNASNTLQLKWNENDTVNRTLNLLVSGASRSLTLGGDLTTSGGNLTITLDQPTTVNLSTSAVGSVIYKTSSAPDVWEDSTVEMLDVLDGVATGDIIYADSATSLTTRTIGTTGQVLTVTGGVPVWATPVRKHIETAIAGNTTNFAANGAHVFTITHNFGTADVIVQIRDANDQIIGVNLDTTGPNTVTASYNAQANTTLYAVVIG